VYFQRFSGGHVGRGIIESRNAITPANLHELGRPDLTVGLGRVEEEHHGRSIADGAVDIVSCVDFNQADAAIPNGMIVWKPVRPLNDDLVLHISSVRQPLDVGGWFV
jgi:hypothetical protein